MTCQRSGCQNPTKGPRARFCSGACKVAAHRDKKLKPGDGAFLKQVGKMIEESGTMPDTPPPPGPCATEVRERERALFERPCAEGGIKHHTGCPHDTGKVIEDPCPAPEACETKQPHRHVSKPAYAAPKPLDRSHAPGCPCWTCKGIPSKKPSPKKP